MPKYHNTATEADGYRFDSQAEAWHYFHLRSLVEAGEITDLRVHPRYTLLEPFTRHGKRVRAITYTPDFDYLRADGRRVAVDVKGGRATQTEAFKLRAKLFMWRYPDVELVIEAY
mgnify:FL=1